MTGPFVMSVAGLEHFSAHVRSLWGAGCADSPGRGLRCRWVRVLPGPHNYEKTPPNLAGSSSFVLALGFVRVLA